MSCCVRCQQFLNGKAKERFSSPSKKQAFDASSSTADDASHQALSERSSSERASCSICFGVWTKQFSNSISAAVKEAVSPYYQQKQQETTMNVFSRRLSPPMVVLPGDIAYRYQVELTAKELSSKATPVLVFSQEIKQHAKTVLNECLDEIEQEQNRSSAALDTYPSCIQDEELGYLAVHVVVMPSSNVNRPLHMPASHQRGSSNKKGRKRNMLHEDSQGGDPRSNLEARLNRKGLTVWSIKQAAEQLSSSSASLRADDIPPGEFNVSNNKNNALEFHVAVWRRPFYLRGMYTKTRRDVSQTPFHVVDQGKRRKLGVTSVEEQITPAMVRHCGGISNLNNDDDPNNKSNLVFGMAKFHASGREDMDVRMLLPPLQNLKPAGSDDEHSSVQITGRPFVYAMIDAFRLPPMDTLSSIVHDVNHFTDDSNDTPDDPRSYGRNPMGVGISPELTYVPSSAFKGLQEETENKVKYYGCHCWSEKPLPAADEDLTQQLGTFPLELCQRTPIRVLHRRANTIRIRRVLACRAYRIDDHYFRLHLSTSAGTYVKEFVHGDLGRTVPSVSSLLGCSTDILELDCEGIQVS